MAGRVCWKCKTNGNNLLQSHQETESLCEKCLVWGTLAALIHHGPIANTPSILGRRNGRLAPPLSAYPLHWQSAYRASQPAYDEEITASMPQTAHGLAIADIFYKQLVS